MLIVVLACVFLIELSAVIYYDVLRILNRWLPRLHIPSLTKLLALMFAAFVAHGLEIAIYGVTVFALIKYVDVGSLAGRPLSFVNSIYLSAETYTWFGFGDVTPTGPLQLIAGMEALNGLLQIGWSASDAYIVMEQFWSMESNRPDQQP